MTTKHKVIFILKKLLQLITVMLVLSVIVFVISRLSPGDPLRAYYGDGFEHMSTIEKQEAYEYLGLDKPLIVQYGKWIRNAVKGDFGISYKYKRPVIEVIEGVWMNTLLLGGLSFVLIFVFGTMLGIFCAMREGSRTDTVLCKAGVVSSGIPAFFTALILILVFAVKIPIFPTSGAYAIGSHENAASRLYHLILPLSVLVLEHLWYYTYMIRNKLLEEARQDYVMLCKIKGLSRKTIMRRHCLRNIMPSMITIMAVSLPHILGGTYIVEMVFSYPGIGTLSFESARYQDYNMLLLLCLITAFVVVAASIIAQIISESIDPRMRYALAAEDIQVISDKEIKGCAHEE